MNFRYKKLLFVLSVFFMALFLLYFSLRNSLLNYYLTKKLSSYEERFHTKIAVKSAEFNGVTSLLFQGITMAPASSDTLLKIDSVFFTIRIFPLFAGKIRFNDLKISNTSIHFIRKKERNNFSYLLIKKGKIKF